MTLGSRTESHETGDDWDSMWKIGEDTGRQWRKFTGRNELTERIWILERDLQDPMEWR